MTKSLTWSLVLGLVGTAALAQAGNIQSVRHLKAADGTHSIVVTGENLVKPKIITVAARNTTIVEFAAGLKTNRGTIKVNDANVSSVQFGWFSAKPPKVRFAFRTTGKFAPVLTELNNGWSIDFGSPVKKAVPAKPNRPESADQVPLTTPVIAKAEEKKTDTQPEEKKVDVPTLPTKQDYVPFGATQRTSSTLTATREVESDLQQVVSLDFVGTDILQILKALSIQSSVNIVASPDVSEADKPVKLTVSLSKVSLDEALSYITAISGLRYARVGNTYIVTKSENFSAAMRQVMERMGGRYETRVVNLISGQAQKIKEATEKALPPSGKSGFYEVIVPTGNELPGVAPTATGSSPDGQAQPQSNSSAQPTRTARIYYLMVVGDPARVNEVETYIRDLDSKISDSSSFSRQAELRTVVVPVQSGETGRIKVMIDRLISEHPRAAEFTVQESILEGTTKGEATTMTLLMIGPKDDVARLEDFAKALDKELCSVMGRTYESDLVGLEKFWEVVDLRYVEPSLIELDLKTRFKGLQISLLPDPVTPGLRGETSSSETNNAGTGTGGGAGTGGNTGAAGDGGQESQSGSTSEKRSITGREPMRLVLRGTRSQIEEAKSYISMIDVAPRQIALELRVLEMTKEEALRLGIDWNVITGGRLNPIRINQGLGDTASSPGTITGAYQTQDTDTVSFLGTLDQLNGGRNLIARPNALVSDGRTTNLFVGDTVRYIKTIQATQNGTTVETGEVQVGVTFKIQARVGGNGEISLALDQNFSILTGFTPVPGGGNLPQTSDRLTSMHVNMRSGETLALGGLILEQDRKKVNGIPILKDLPIIGALFSRTDNSKSKTEIVFFLTAVEVNEGNRAHAASPATGTQRVPDPLGDYARERAPKTGGNGKKTL